MSIIMQPISMYHTIIHKTIIGLTGAKTTIIIMKNSHSIEIPRIILRIISLVTEVNKTIIQGIKTTIETAQIITDQTIITEAVSYTHLDVYKRQGY